MSVGKQSVYLSLYFFLSNFVSQESAASCLMQVLMSPMMLWSPMVYTCMLNLEGRFSRCRSNSQCTSFSRLRTLSQLSLIRQASHFCCTAGDILRGGECEDSGGFMRSKPLSLAAMVVVEEKSGETCSTLWQHSTNICKHINKKCKCVKNV